MIKNLKNNKASNVDYYQFHNVKWLWAIISFVQLVLFYYVIANNEFSQPIYLVTLLSYCVASIYMAPKVFVREQFSTVGVYLVVALATVNWLLMTICVGTIWEQHIAAERIILIGFFSLILGFSASKFLLIVSTTPLIILYGIYQIYYDENSGIDLFISIIKFPLFIYAIILTLGKHNNRLIDSHKQLILLNEKLTTLKNTDPLTKLNNRRAFDERLEFILDLHHRDGQDVSLMILDIDYFKKYNDSLGHPQGDLCLKLVSDVLKDSVKRSTDTVARIGGEEFAIILPHTSLIDCQSVAQRVIDNVRLANIEHPLSEVSPLVTISIGCASVDAQTDTCELFYKQADAALYRAKDAGRARYSI